MPQLLFYLEAEGRGRDEVELDWGCLAVFSCSASCHPLPPDSPDSDSAYADEYVWVQPHPS
jgi:hypothetical protein